MVIGNISDLIVEIYGMSCELVPNSVDHCQMTSPQHVPGNVTGSCLIVDYQLSSDDISLTADISVGGNTVIEGKPFREDRGLHFISLTNLPSINFTVTFSAERPQTTLDATQYASITQVRLGFCSNFGAYYTGLRR